MSRAPLKTLVIAGTQSGVGKTTLTVGLIAALRTRGWSVQPFKVGPDYIDPGFHTLAAGRPCRNLDTWLMRPEQTRSLFEEAARHADCAIIEGVMGLFDGLGYDDETGSTAQVAKLLRAPVLLVIDARKVARSAAAVAQGFQRFDPALNVAGFIVNGAGSAKHGAGVAHAITAATGLPVFGWLQRDERLHVPERHLGLIPSAEPGRWSEFVQAAGDMVARCVDLDKIVERVGACELPPASRSSMAAQPQNEVVIAVARDEAFHFCYEENLLLLREAGAKLEFFSPLRDTHLPRNTAGVLLSGGFPEVYAAALSANASMHEALRQAQRHGLPIYAECGGVMYLTQGIVDLDGHAFPMVGLLPGRSVMTRRLTLGYREARAGTPSWLLHEDEMVRGHEFHYSIWEDRPPDMSAAYRFASPTEMKPEGACVGSLWASYLHLHFWAKPELAERFVSACRHARTRRPSEA